MRTDGLRGFLAALSCDADLSQALAVGERATDGTAHGFQLAREALAEGRAPDQALANLRGAPVVALLCSHARPDQRPAVAAHLVRAFGPVGLDSAVRLHRGLRHQLGLYIALMNAIVLTLMIAACTLFVVPSFPGAERMSQLLGIGALAVFIAGLIALVEILRTTFLGAQSRTARRRLLLYLAAAESAQVSLPVLLPALHRRQRHPLPRTWVRRLAEDRYDWLGPDLARLAGATIDGEPREAMWARLATIASRDEGRPLVQWPGQLSIALSALGVGLATVGTFHSLLRLGELVQ